MPFRTLEATNDKTNVILKTRKRKKGGPHDPIDSLIQPQVLTGVRTLLQQVSNHQGRSRFGPFAPQALRVER